MHRPSWQVPLPRNTQCEGGCRVSATTSTGLFLEQVPPNFSNLWAGFQNMSVYQCKMRWSGKCALGDHLHFRAQPKYYEMLAKIARRFLHSWSFVGHPSPLVRRQRKFRWNSQLGLSYHQEVKFSLVVMSYVPCNLRIAGEIRDDSRLSVLVVWQI